jgi:PEP-CTERM motif
MRSHFTISSGAAMACAVTGATAMLTASVCSAQIAADFASDPTYSSGWTAGQNGGSGFGAWSFTGTGGGSGQEMSSASAIGTAWTLFNTSSSAGISDVGRAITGGLQVGQTFETVIQNPSTTAGYFTYRGFDILFTGGTDNNAGGDNTSALRAQVFDYFNSSLNWNIKDANPSQNISLTGPTTAAAGVQIDLTLTSATAYSLIMTPLNGATAYSQNGTYAGPITYVNFRLYNTASSGPNDVANNFGISYMTIVPEPTTLALMGLGAAGLMFLRRRK